jgi:hypothetical protein
MGLVSAGFILLLVPAGANLGVKQGRQIQLTDQSALESALDSRITSMEARLEKKLESKVDEFTARLEALGRKMDAHVASVGGESIGGGSVGASVLAVDYGTDAKADYYSLKNGGQTGSIDCSTVEENVTLSGKQPVQALSALRRHADCSQVHHITMHFQTTTFSAAESVGELVDIFLLDRFEWQVISEPYGFNASHMKMSITLRKVRDAVLLEMAAFVKKRQFPARCSDRKILALKVLSTYQTFVRGSFSLAHVLNSTAAL